MSRDHFCSFAAVLNGILINGLVGAGGIAFNLRGAIFCSLFSTTLAFLAFVLEAAVLGNGGDPKRYHPKVWAMVAMSWCVSFFGSLIVILEG